MMMHADKSTTQLIMETAANIIMAAVAIGSVSLALWLASLAWSALRGALCH